MHGQRVQAPDIKPDKVQKLKYKMKDFKCCEKLVWEDKERGRIKYLLSSARCWLDKVGTLPLGWLIPSGKIGNTRSANLSQATGCKYIQLSGEKWSGGENVIYWKVKVGRWGKNTFFPLQIQSKPTNSAKWSSAILHFLNLPIWNSNSSLVVKIKVKCSESKM